MSGTFIAGEYRFGPVAVSGACGEFYRALNDAVIGLMRGLPAPVQGQAMLLYLAYSGLALGDRLDFFRNYYVPCWSVIPRASGNALSPGDMALFAGAHAMAMILHSLDDHLNDGEIPPTHLALLVRSQAWKVFMDGIDALAPEERRQARELVDEYYAAITDGNVPESLEEYCGRFRGQMATGTIIPVTAASRALGGDAAKTLRRAHEHFGVAWRLLDDLQDTEEDFMKGGVTAVFFLLGDAGKELWLGRGGEKHIEALAPVIRDAGVFPALGKMIVVELSRAADLAAGAGLPGLAEEYRLLAEPLFETIGAHG